MGGESKVIEKADDASKLFIQKSLAGDVTHGFDLDSVYCIQGEYYVFEYLKCDNLYVTPHTSNPRFYPYNWKKFYSLWQTTQRLKGRLFLVNYSDRAADSHLVKVMYVEKFDYAKLEEYVEYVEKTGDIKVRCDYLVMKEYRLTFKQFSDYLKKLNAMATLPVEENEALPAKVAAALNLNNTTAVSHPVLPF